MLLLPILSISLINLSWAVFLSFYLQWATKVVETVDWIDWANFTIPLIPFQILFTPSPFSLLGRKEIKELRYSMFQCIQCSSLSTMKIVEWWHSCAHDNYGNGYIKTPNKIIPFIVKCFNKCRKEASPRDRKSNMFWGEAVVSYR